MLNMIFDLLLWLVNSNCAKLRSNLALDLFNRRFAVDRISRGQINGRKLSWAVEGGGDFVSNAAVPACHNGYPHSRKVASPIGAHLIGGWLTLDMKGNFQVASFCDRVCSLSQVMKSGLPDWTGRTRTHGTSAGWFSFTNLISGSDKCDCDLRMSETSSSSSTTPTCEKGYH